MIINSTQSQPLPKTDPKNVIKWGNLVKDPNRALNGNLLLKRNFDTLTITDEKDSQKTKNLELIKNVKTASKESTHDEQVHYNYFEMQKIIYGQIGKEISMQKSYHYRKEEQSYLNNLLNSTPDDKIFIEEGKYCFDQGGGTIMERENVQNYLERSEKAFSELINPSEFYQTEPFAGTFPNDLGQKIFGVFARAFSELTGLSSTALDPFSDDTLLLRHQRTEENFFEESNKNIELLKQRSTGLAELMKEYVEKNGIQEADENNFEAKKMRFAINSLHKLLSDFGVANLEDMF